MITMILGGLWHGASWNFVVWGAYHGLLLVLYHAFRKAVDRTHLSRLLDAKCVAPLKVIATFVFILLGWVFFRAETFDGAVLVINNMFEFGRSSPKSLFMFHHWFMLALVSAVAIAEEQWNLLAWLSRSTFWARAALYALVFISLAIFGVLDLRVEFIYFQF